MRHTLTAALAGSTALAAAALVGPALIAPVNAADPECVPAGSGRVDCTASSENTDGTPDADYTFRQSLHVAYGSNIVIRGLKGYRTAGGADGSVVNFFVDAEVSGDPDTVNTKRTVKHPVTGVVVGDKRTHAMVQGGGKGAWKVTIPFPTDANASTLGGAKLKKLWRPGTQHSVRMLTGTLVENDLRRFASARFTITKAQPKLGAKLAKAKIKKGQRGKVKVTAKIPGAAKVKATGKVVVFAGKKRVGAVTLKAKHNGKVAVKLKKLKKGKHKITVRLRSHALQKAASANAKKLAVR